MVKFGPLVRRRNSDGPRHRYCQQWGLSPGLLTIPLRQDENELRSEGHLDLHLS